MNRTMLLFLSLMSIPPVILALWMFYKMDYIQLWSVYAMGGAELLLFILLLFVKEPNNGSRPR